jgi:hypothetical protein
MSKITTIPRELSKQVIKKKLEESGNLYSENITFIDKCTSLVQMIYFKQLLDDRKSEDMYVRLYAQILKQNYGGNIRQTPIYYKYIIDTLINIGILVVDNQYFANNGKGLSKGYGLSIEKSEDLIKDEITNECQRYFVVDDEHHFDCLTKIDIDEQKYVFISNIIKYSRQLKGFGLLSLSNSNIFPVFKDKNDRIYSFITQLPREYRNSLSVNGSEIHEVDFHACQPFLFLKMFFERINKGTSKNRKTMAELLEANPGLEKYVSLIQNNEFYSYLFPKYKSRHKNFTEREFKLKLISEVFFDKPKDKPRGLCRIFNEEFPTIYQMLIKIKKEDEENAIANGYKKGEGYKAVANRLQKEESLLMNIILDKIQNKIDWKLRLHDAILCKQKDANYIKNVMHEEAYDFVGINGYVKSGKWGDSISKIMRDREVWEYRVRQITDWNNVITKKADKIKSRIIEGHKGSYSKEFWEQVGIEKANMVLKMFFDKRRKKYLKIKAIYPSDWDKQRKNDLTRYALNHILPFIKDYNEKGGKYTYDHLRLKAFPFWKKYFSVDSD